MLNIHMFLNDYFKETPLKLVGIRCSFDKGNLTEIALVNNIINQTMVFTKLTDETILMNLYDKNNQVLTHRRDTNENMLTYIKNLLN